VDVATFEHLLTPAGQRVLAAAAAAAGEGEPRLALASRLRGRHDPTLVAAALSQVDLRCRAEAKFGADAARLYFTRDGLEQATHPVVAHHRAMRATEWGVTRGLDLGCGIGSDLAAMLAAGVTAAGVDLDPLTVAVARANLAALGLRGEVRVGDAVTEPRDGFDLVVCDPARRSGGSRVFDPAAYSPGWEFVQRLLAGPACVKAAPGLPHSLIPEGVDAEWVSFGGRLKEVALWSGGPARGRRAATVLSGPATPHTLVGDPSADRPDVRAVGRFVYDPDDSVTVGHLVADLAGRLDAWLLDERIGYLSSDRAQTSPWARCYEVLEVLPFKEKQLRAALRARDVGTLTIKKRGVAVRPEHLRRRLSLSGTQEATLILTRTPRSARALLVRPAP
jgi:hypothetical protein